MNKTIAYKWDSGEGSLDKAQKDRGIFYAKDQKEAYLYHIEQADVDSYILNCSHMTIVEAKAIVRHIHYLNAIMTIVLYKADYGIFESLLKNGNIHIAGNIEQVADLLVEAESKGRSSNRVQWPLKAEYWKGSTEGEERDLAMVTSISSSGCFLKTEKKQSAQKGDHMSLLFHFRDFDFLADGNVVRLVPEASGATAGMALEFREVSPQTERYIQEIIDEKILSEIMHMIK